MKNLILFVLLMAALNISCAVNNANAEIASEEAIRIAADAAKKHNFDTSLADVELMKVKNGVERGPLRIVWLVRSYPKEISSKLLKEEFWVVYFYPKGQLENATILGGDFTTFIDLHSGKVIDAFVGQ